METTDLAMVSRIRVEVHGGSMEAAERAAFVFLEHARMAGVLEGIAPLGGEFTDHFFNRPEVTSKPGDAPEPWTELGMHYAGRLTFTFDPAVADGGLKQSGYKVFADESEYAIKSGADGEETTATVMVLPRQRSVTREHSWEVSSVQMSIGETGESILDDIRSIRDVKEVSALVKDSEVSVHIVMDGWENVNEQGGSLFEAAGKARKAVIAMLDNANGSEASDDEIIENISRLVGVESVAHSKRRIDQYPEPEGWAHRVVVTFNDEREAVEGRGQTKREAALNAYGKCGVEVTHYDTRGGMPSDEEVRAAAHLGVRGDE